MIVSVGKIKIIFPLPNARESPITMDEASFASLDRDHPQAAVTAVTSGTRRCLRRGGCKRGYTGDFSLPIMNGVWELRSLPMALTVVERRRTLSTGKTKRKPGLVYRRLFVGCRSPLGVRLPGSGGRVKSSPAGWTRQCGVSKGFLWRRRCPPFSSPGNGQVQDPASPSQYVPVDMAVYSAPHDGVVPWDRQRSLSVSTPPTYQGLVALALIAAMARRGNRLVTSGHPTRPANRTQTQGHPAAGR